MYKYFVVGALLLVSTEAVAEPYIEYKNELPFKGEKSQDVTQHLRLGYQFDNKMYLEAGPMTDGYGFETGYKFKMDNLIIKGKFEGADSDERDYIKSKLETEIRYTF
tara:strand:- start:109 stop:429 length:321 start_codon:yes stop_codon:yes gene_type:complete